MSNPDEIRAQIEQTRGNLSNDVNALADTVTPSHIAKRQTDKVRGAVFGAKDKVMGSASHASSGISSATDTVTSAPAQLEARTAGNPLAAGLIAFGVGWLAGSLLPSSSVEQQAAAKVKTAATPLAADAAKEVADHLKEPAQDALEAVKSSATDAAATIKDEGASAVQDVQH